MEELRSEDGGVLISDDVKKRLQKRVRRRNALIVLTCVVVGAVILTVAAFFTVKEIFTVEQIFCPDTPYYSGEEILEAAGAKTGKAIFSMDEETFRKNALQSLPMLQDLKVKKEYPDKLTVTPVLEEPLFYFVASVPENEYVVVAKSLKVLEMIDDEEVLHARYKGLLWVKMPRLLYTVTGQELRFADRGDGTYLPSFVELIGASSFAPEVKALDLVNRFEIVVYCETEQGAPYRIYFGNSRQAKEKLAFAEGIKKNLPEGFVGLIGVEDPQKGYADPEES